MIRGASYTIDLIFNAEYDVTRVKDIRLTIGNYDVCSLADGISNSGQHFLCSIPSDITAVLPVGERSVTLTMEDATDGVRKAIIATIPIQNTGSRYENENVSETANMTLELTYMVNNISADLLITDVTALRAIAAAAAAKVSEDNSKVSEDNAKQSETNAAQSKSTTEGYKNTVQGLHDTVVADAAQVALDRIATGEDTTQTALDRIATGQDAQTATTKAGEASDSAAAALQSKNYASGYADDALASKNAAAISATTALNAASATILGGIAYDAVAPTPGKSGKYYFTTAGSCTWLTGGAASVLIGQEVLVVFTSPSTYAYTLLAVTANYVTNSQKKTIKASLIPDSQAFTDNAYYHASITPTVDSRFKALNALAISPLKFYRLRGGFYGTTAETIITDASNNILKRIIAGAGYTEASQLNEIEFIAPLDSAFIYISHYKNSPTDLALYESENGLKYDKYIDTFALMFPNQYYIKNSDGSEVWSATWRTSDYLPIEATRDTIAHLNGHPSINAVSFYTDKLASSIILASSIKLTDITPSYGDVTLSDSNIPSAAKYVRFTTEKDKSYYLFAIGLRPYINIKSDEETLASLQSGALNPKLAHISFDDVTFALQDITTNSATYTSIFNNPFFSALKTLHDTHGAVFSLFCFTSATGWTLAGTTNKFASEFAANSSWLKFGLHLNPAYANYSATTAEQALADYNTFTAAIISITGTPKCIDRCPRLHNFAGNLVSMLAMRDAAGGIIGLLAAYDSRDSYYLSTSDSALVFNNGRFYDSTNHLTFFPTLMTFEVTNPSTTLPAMLTLASNNKSNDLIMMMHEYAIYGNDFTLVSAMVDRLTYACQWVQANGYIFNYPMNKILL